MAYVLSLMPHSPLAAPYQERRYERSWSSLGSNGTVQHHRNRQHSAGSLASAASLYSNSWPLPDRHIPIRSTSYSDLDIDQPSPRPRTSSTISRLGLCPISPLRGPTNTELRSSTPPIAAEDEPESTKEQDIAALELVDEEDANPKMSKEAPSLNIEPEILLLQNNPLDIDREFGPETAENAQRPFKKWLSTLRRRKARHITRAVASVPKDMAGDHDHGGTRNLRKSESWTSSVDFVTAVKSASVTVASLSASGLSRSGTRRSARSRLWRESSGSELRRSVNSGAQSSGSVVDEAAQQRSRKRREKLEELIRTEESYVSDLKALSNAYFTILPPLLPHSTHTRMSARSNIADLIQLHDRILGELHRVIPLSDYNSTAAAEKTTMSNPVHIRWRSSDGTSQLRPRQVVGHAGWSKRRSLDIRATLKKDATILSCSPETVSEVAKIFARNTNRFAMYEEYGARCELMHEDVGYFQKMTLSGPDYDKAIEALCASQNPTNTKEDNKRKALSLKDLLIKPIQRITRYELLFRDLCKYTPSCDDPRSHAILGDVLQQMSRTCCNVNQAKENPEKLRFLESSWLLQDRLVFDDKIPRTLLFQRLGRLFLCGTLYVAYRTRNQVQGRYMVCILYESCLILAVAESSTRYNVMVAASLSTIGIEETDNGKGLQCHTAPNTWKLVFESAGKMFEVVFAACSEVEERIWRDQLSDRITIETRNVAEFQAPPLELSSPLSKELRNIGKAYGNPEGFPRRLSIQRTATLGPLSDLNQVIIKNTEALKDECTNTSSSSLPIPRSQSVTTPSHVPTLAPLRQERMKLESILDDVWTKGVIPYPGMGTRRSEYSIRDTANDLIRKLSMASIASNFSKRSMSYTGVSGAYPAHTKPVKTKKARPENSKPKRPPLIDFQNAPDAFLPEDFELHDPRTRSGRGLNLRSFTMTGYDRPRSPFFFSQDNKVPEVKRSKSVRQLPGAEVLLCRKTSTEAIAVRDGKISRQSNFDTGIKCTVKEVGKKERFLKFLGKVRSGDD